MKSNLQKCFHLFLLSDVSFYFVFALFSIYVSVSLTELIELLIVGSSFALFRLWKLFWQILNWIREVTALG